MPQPLTQLKRRVVRIAPEAIRVTAVRKDPPDLDRFVAALLALAMDRVDQERARCRLPKINLLPDDPAVDHEAA